MGLRPLRIDSAQQVFQSSIGGVAISIRDLIRFGARWEDELGALQAARHFYDPVNDRALDVGGSIGTSKTIKSPDWALEDVGDFQGVTSFQNFSLKDAHNAFYRALTHENPLSTLGAFNERQRSFGLMFQTLGHVMHHLQDMAQPQHVRNDIHCDRGACIALQNLLNVNQLYAPSLYEKYSNLDNPNDPLLRIRSNLPYSGPGSGAVYPGANTGTTPFRNPRHFWRTTPVQSDITPGKGIAEYTNRNFHSEGTIGTYPSPPRPTITNYFTPSERVDIKQLLPGTSLAGTVTFWDSQVTDALAGTLGTNRRALSEGLLDRDLVQFYSTPGTGYMVFTLNRFTFDAAHQFLIPRAVGYSAGLINYFFRGQLEITPPDEGVYGILDHTVENRPDVDGFGKIKLNIRNITPGGTDAQGQPQVEPIPNNSPGTLVAVVKFHRNNCYLANLGGEYGAPGIDWHTCRSPLEEIVVSMPQPVPNGINDGPKPMAFTFANRIPINATDMYLQVVYRGPLGEEADAVVVATRDIAEPLYLNQYSYWDQFLYANFPVVEPGPYTFQQWCAQGYATYDDCRNGMGTTLKLRFSATPGYSLNPAFPEGTWNPLAAEPPFAPVATMTAPVGTYARVALLADGAPQPMVYLWEWVNPTYSSLFQWQSATLLGNRNQFDPDTNQLTPLTSYVAGRGIFVSTGAGPLLNSGTAPNIPPLVPAPSQINF